MTRLRRALRASALVAVGVLVGVAGGGGTYAALSGDTENPGDRVTAAPDFVAPTVSATVIGKSSGGTPGYVRAGGGYYVYANVSDTGNPASGVGSVAADVSALTPGLTAAPLTSGSYSAGGQSYGYRSALLTAATPLSEGAKTYSITASDSASNSRTDTGHEVTVDNTPPSAADVQATNTSGGTAGRAEQGDTLTLTFSEPVEPSSILSGWSGSNTNVTVRLIDGSLLGLGNDQLEIYDAADSSRLPLGRIDLGAGNYVATVLGLGTARFDSSVMQQSASSLTITLGAHSGASATQGGPGAMTWSGLSSAVVDRAGNAASTASASESGGSDREF